MDIVPDLSQTRNQENKRSHIAGGMFVTPGILPFFLAKEIKNKK